MGLGLRGERLLLACVVVCCGCGGGGATSISAPPENAPVITKQPANESVPMGLGAEFAVGVSDDHLAYQWMRNGAPISGATASSYNLPAVATSDSATKFSVQVSNDAGAVTSQAATLTVTARAPKPGDLRFQQVDAASTVNGYVVGSGSTWFLSCPPPGGGYGAGMTFAQEAGMPFRLTNDACMWPMNEYESVPAIASISTAYMIVPASGLQDSLSQSVISVPAATDSGSVVIALGRTAVASDTIAVAYENEQGVASFTPEQATVDAGSLQAAATEEGLHGRVITALYADGANISYFSYGWQGDPNTTYEAKVVTGTLDQASDMVAALAAEGYIVTATYCTEATDGSGVWMVGTRVQGDSMPRPVLSVAEPAVQQLADGGYAVVAVAMKWDAQDDLVVNQYIGER